jgi:hypothetical protein
MKQLCRPEEELSLPNNLNRFVFSCTLCSEKKMATFSYHTFFLLLHKCFWPFSFFWLGFKLWIRVDRFYDLFSTLKTWSPSGWPDWPNFRHLCHRFLLDNFLKNYKCIPCFWGTFSQKKACIKFEIICIELHFGRFFGLKTFGHPVRHALNTDRWKSRHDYIQALKSLTEMWTLLNF